MISSNLKLEQEVHGPRRSPAKQFQTINTFAQSLLKHNNDYEKKNHICFLRIKWSFICKNLRPRQSGMLCAKCGWNWHSGFGEEDFLISSMYFC